MATEGPNSPSASSTAGIGPGMAAWSNASNQYADDGNRASVSLAASGDLGNGDESGWLRASGFGFSIPSGATVDGFVVEWKRYGGNSSGSFDYTRPVADVAVRIVKGGTVGSTERSAGANWPLSESGYDSYGSSSDLWGETWSHSDVNDSGFGCAIAVGNFLTSPTEVASAYVNHVRITVHYTTAAGAPPATQARVFRRPDLPTDPIFAE